MCFNIHGNHKEPLKADKNIVCYKKLELIRGIRLIKKGETSSPEIKLKSYIYYFPYRLGEVYKSKLVKGSHNSTGEYVSNKIKLIKVLTQE